MKIFFPGYKKTFETVWSNTEMILYTNDCSAYITEPYAVIKYNLFQTCINRNVNMIARAECIIQNTGNIHCKME